MATLSVADLTRIVRQAAASGRDVASYDALARAAGVADARALLGGTADVPAPAEPSLLRKAANFVTSAGRHIARGLPTVEPEEKERRLSICRTCPFGAYVAATETCKLCGCRLKVKTAWAQEKCPKGLW